MPRKTRPARTVEADVEEAQPLGQRIFQPEIRRPRPVAAPQGVVDGVPAALAAAPHPLLPGLLDGNAADGRHPILLADPRPLRRAERIDAADRQVKSPGLKRGVEGQARPAGPGGDGPLPDGEDDRQPAGDAHHRKQQDHPSPGIGNHAAPSWTKMLKLFTPRGILSVSPGSGKAFRARKNSRPAGNKCRSKAYHGIHFVARSDHPMAIEGKKGSRKIADLVDRGGGGDRRHRHPGLCPAGHRRRTRWSTSRPKIERGPVTNVVSATGVLQTVVTVQVGSQVSGPD